MRSTILLAFSLASIPIAFAQQKVSTSARCGSDFGGRTCKGSTFGNCCSQYSYCGSTEAYCGKGCQAGFGDCVQVPKSSSVSKPSTTSTVIVSQSTRTSVSAPASTLKVTTNARCGKEGNDRTCKGSKWGNCCSQYSYCGSTDAYCGKGCQSVFGDCKGSVSSSSRVVSSTRTSSSSSISSVFSTSAATSSSVVSSSPAASSSSVPSSSSTASSSSDVSSSVVPSSSSLASSSIIASSTAVSSTVLSSSSSAAPSPTSLTSSDIVSTTTVASSSTIESSSVVSSSSTVESSSVIPLSTIASSSAIITSSDIPSSTIASPSATPTPQGTSCPNIGATFTASNGKVYNVNCNGFYPIRGGGVVGTSNQPTLAGCLESCAQNSQCIAADYNPNSGLCDLANSNVSGLVSGFNSGRLVGS